MSADSRAYFIEDVRFYATMGLVKFWKPALIGLAVLAAFIYGRCGGTPPASDPGVVDTVMVDRPSPEPTIKERIVYRQVPVERRVIVTEVDTMVVREFVEAVQNPDSLPATHLPYAIEYDGEQLQMWGTMSDGSRSYSEYDLRPTFKAGWDADSTWAREERLARLRGIGGVSPHLVAEATYPLAAVEPHPGLELEGPLQARYRGVAVMPYASYRDGGEAGVKARVQFF